MRQPEPRRSTRYPGRRRSRTKRPVDPVFNRRLKLTCGVIAVVLVALVAQMVRLQGSAGAELVRRGRKQRLVTYPVKAQRGSILDRRGDVLAVSVPRRTVVVNKPNLAAAGYDEWALFEGLSRRIAPFLGRKAEVVAQTLKDSSPDDPYVVLARNVPVSKAQKLHDLLVAEDRKNRENNPNAPRLTDALYFERASERINPAGESGLRIIGRYQTDGPARNAGIESAFDDDLRGTDGENQVELKNGFDRSVEGWSASITGEGQVDLSRKGGALPGSEQVLEEAVPGSAVKLTLDRAMQHEVERILAVGAADAGARRGVAIVGKPTTGELLAVAGVEVDPKSGRMGLATGPLAFSNAYQAGSVFKLVTVASALEAGVVGADTVLSVPDHLAVADRSYRDHDPHPTEPMSVTEIVAKSSNVGTILIAQKLGKERLHKSLLNFGFGQKVDIGHPAEAAGTVPPFEKWTAPDLASASIGTHEAATALQLWAAYNVVANEGMYVPPRLVDVVIHPDGTRDVRRPNKPRRVMSADAARAMSGILQSVITEGTAKQWTLPGYSIAAKTGTSRMPSPKRVDRRDGYLWEDGAYHYLAAFTGYLPASRPQVSITVILDDVNAGLYGSTAAGPIFSQIARLSIRNLGIAPDQRADNATGTELLPGTVRSQDGRIRSAPATRAEVASDEVNPPSGSKETGAKEAGTAAVKGSATGPPRLKGKGQ